MVKINSLLKKMWTVLAVLFCSVVSAQAAGITYQLTTHVDGRTITASKSVSAGASLIDNMPQQLWRASTTYKFYADADLTEEITEVPAEDATVYVDYEFNPPFAVAENTTDGPYYTLRGFYANGNPYYFYADGNKVDAIVGSIEGLRNQDQAKWAYIGDGFSLNLYNKATGTWLAFDQSDPTMQANPLEKGWQLYSNNYVNPHYPEVSAYFMLAVPSADESLKNNTQIFGVSNMSGKTTLDHPGGSGSVALDNKGHWNEQGVWQHGQDKISWASLFGTLQEGVLTIWHVEYRIFDEDNNLIDQKFYDKENEAKAVNYYYDATDAAYDECAYYHDAEFTQIWEPNDANDLIPATGTTIVYVRKVKSPVEPVIYYVTYKIQKADGTWYEDIVKEKDPNNLTPAFPTEYTQKEGYTYDYFYKDENFTEKCAEDYTMPADENTVLFIKETAPVYTVTYKIQQADGTWYEDIVKEKDPNNLTPAFPSEEYSMKDGCEYDYFYQDETFQEKFEGDMPANENTVLYIKEKVIEYVSEPWKTLVIPFGIENLASFFGEDFEGVPAVDVLEFQNIEDGVITRVGDEDFYRCKLIFNPVYFIEAYKPYLIRLNRAYKSARDEMYAAEKGERDCEVTIVNDPANAGISVYMEGTLEDNGYSMDASDGLHFYFGYDDRANAYNFYRVSAQIPRNRCWFEVVDQRPAGAKLNVTFDMDAITGIGQVVSAKAADGRIYNINGQQVQGTFQKGIYIVNGKKVIVK